MRKQSIAFIVALFLCSILLGQQKALVFFKSKEAPVITDWYDADINQGNLEGVEALGLEIKAKSKWLNAVQVEGNSLSELLMLEGVKGYIELHNNASGNNLSSLETTTYSAIKKDGVNPALNLEMHNYKFMASTDKLGGKGVKIAIFDGGFSSVDVDDWSEPLRSSGRIVATKNFVLGGEMVYDKSSHGTRVLSVIAGTQGSYIGSAPNADFYLVVTENAVNERLEEEFNWALGAEWAFEEGINVINSSLGYTEFDVASENHVHGDLDGHTTPAAKAALIAARKGIIVVNSAGNSGQRPWRKIGTPADADSILTVGAVDSSRNIAGFSSHGPTADGRLKPEVSALGVLTLTNFKDKVEGANGTSFSSPVMAGLAARLLALFPKASNLDIREALIKASDRFMFPDTLYGYGIPNFELAYRYLENTQVGTDFVVLYPNPVSNVLTIAGQQISGLQKIQVVDVVGKLIVDYQVQSSAKKQDLSWITQGLNAGNYKLVLYYESGKKEAIPFNKL